ncbi:hypothetical protein EYF80_031917 [Liparis tanakae]|uniref:Uncharacterized protein n=1 Tax=Liparis tanakae TaxID=230148 RepID=A0A4Z2GXK3_9TELE|nr:hypothetical protein EYF80_031917 [Liparis tanakae]
MFSARYSPVRNRSASDSPELVLRGGAVGITRSGLLEKSSLRMWIGEMVTSQLVMPKSRRWARAWLDRPARVSKPALQNSQCITLNVAPHVIGEPDAVKKPIGAVGALPLHTLERLGVLVDPVRVFVQEALRQETPHVLLVNVAVVVFFAVGVRGSDGNPVAPPRKEHCIVFLHLQLVFVVHTLLVILQKLGQIRPSLPSFAKSPVAGTLEHHLAGGPSCSTVWRPAALRGSGSLLALASGRIMRGSRPIETVRIKAGLGNLSALVGPQPLASLIRQSATGDLHRVN